MTVALDTTVIQRNQNRFIHIYAEPRKRAEFTKDLLKFWDGCRKIPEKQRSVISIRTKSKSLFKTFKHFRVIRERAANRGASESGFKSKKDGVRNDGEDDGAH